MIRIYIFILIIVKDRKKNNLSKKGDFTVLIKQFLIIEVFRNKRFETGFYAMM
jgi:hypothetical protein